MLVSAAGIPKQELEAGQRTSIATDRVIRDELVVKIAALFPDDVSVFGAEEDGAVDCAYGTV
jgi:hypothetical protein